MPKLTEQTVSGPTLLLWEDNRVRFGSFREPRGRAARSPLKLRVLDGATREPFFVEVVCIGAGDFHVDVSGGDFDVYLNGRKIRVGGQEPAMDGDLLRIEDRRFVIGVVPAFPRDAVEARFLEGIRRDPRDDDARLVYADWLEQRDDHAHAELLRLELRLRGTAPGDPVLPDLAKAFHALANDIASMRWRVLVARPLVEGCDVKVELACPKTWEALAPTDRENVRRCDACAKDVVFCSSIDDARRLAQKGGCVALDPAVTRRPNDLDPPVMMVGRLVRAP
jgi:uncharacterized protein (TIGR02996 family)